MRHRRANSKDVLTFRSAKIAAKRNRAEVLGWRGRGMNGEVYCPQHAEEFGAVIILSGSLLKGTIQCAHRDCFRILELHARRNRQTSKA